MKKQTKDEFIRELSAMCGIDAIENLKRLGIDAVPCDCNTDYCGGWKIGNKPSIVSLRGE